MKLFGEYLIEKEVISEEILVQALIKQTSALPSIAQSVFEKKFLSAAQILKIFKAQNQKRTGFIEAALSLGIWSEKLQTDVEEYLALNRMPLGQVLVQIGAAKIEDITHALDDFFAETDPVQTLQDSTGTHETGDQPPSSTEGISDFTPFCDLFTPEFQTSLSSAFLVDPAASRANGAFQKARDDIHRLNGAARLAMATQVGTLLTHMEKILEELQRRNLVNLKPDLRSKIQSNSQRLIDFLWEIQSKLSSVKTEEELFRDPVQANTLRDLGAGLEILIFDLDMLEMAKET